MSESELFMRTMTSVGGIFAAGIVLILILGKFNLRQIFTGELGARYIGWLIIMPIYMLALFTNAIVGGFLLFIGIFIALREYSRAAQITPSQSLYLYASVPITLLIVIFKPPLFAALPALVLFLLTSVPILSDDPGKLHGKLRLVSWGYMYVVWSLSHSILVLMLPDGKGVLIMIIVGCGLADIGAYVIGKAIGHTVIAPSINPRKAWEGLLGDLIGAAISVTIFASIVPAYNLPVLLGFVLIIGIGSSWGDIISSMAKRSSEIKDWGNLIPGHGGILDRLNSLIVVLPLTYYYLVLILPVNP